MNIDNKIKTIWNTFKNMCVIEKVDAYGLKKLINLKKYMNITSTKLSGLFTHVSGRSWIIMPSFTIVVKKSILAIPLKFSSINEYTKPNTSGIEKKIIKINSRIFFWIEKIFNFEITINDIIVNITGIEDGLEANQISIIIESSK